MPRYLYLADAAKMMGLADQDELPPNLRDYLVEIDKYMHVMGESLTALPDHSMIALVIALWARAQQQGRERRAAAKK